VWNLRSIARICFWGEGPFKEPVAVLEGSNNGNAVGKGSLSKAETLKTETLKGRMLFGMAGLGVSHGSFHLF
jgi:hypothetical protein